MFVVVPICQTFITFDSVLSKASFGRQWTTWSRYDVTTCTCADRSTCSDAVRRLWIPAVTRLMMTNIVAETTMPPRRVENAFHGTPYHVTLSNQTIWNHRRTQGRWRSGGL